MMRPESIKVVAYIVQSNKLLLETLLGSAVLTFPKKDVGLGWIVGMSP